MPLRFTEFTAITTPSGYTALPSNIRELDRLYFNNRNFSGWLALLITAHGLVLEDIAYLERLDDLASLSKEQHNGIRQMGKKWAWGIIDKTDGKAAKILKAGIKKIRRKYREMTLEYRPSIERELMLAVNEVEAKERFLRSLVPKTKINPAVPLKDRITDQDIEHARTVDLATLVEPDRTGRIICPFHQDQHPSMWIKNGFGYCFSCGAHCDAIGWLSKVEGFGFIEAVRRLAR